MKIEKLVIVRHYEPPVGGEAAELLRRVYDCLFDAALLERLTRSSPKSTILSGRRFWKGSER